MEAKQIIIVGFMGSGKSSVGQELAWVLERPFVDLDDLITQRQGRSPREIIEHDGEDSFRQLETQALIKVLREGKTQVIAAGGGAWASPQNRDVVNSHGALTIWLDASFELCWKRIESGDELRPLAHSRQAAERLFIQRSPAYQLADLRVSLLDGEAPGTVAARIADLIQVRP